MEKEETKKRERKNQVEQAGSLSPSRRQMADATGRECFQRSFSRARASSSFAALSRNYVRNERKAPRGG